LAGAAEGCRAGCKSPVDDSVEDGGLRDVAVYAAELLDVAEIEAAGNSRWGFVVGWAEEEFEDGEVRICGYVG